MKKLYIILLVVFLHSWSHFGQYVAAYDRLNTLTTTATDARTEPNLTAVGLKRTGVTPSGAEGVGNYGSQNWTTTTTLPAIPTKYLQWSLQVDTGYELILSLLEFSVRRVNQQAPKKVQIFYSKNNFATSTPLTPITTFAQSDTNQRNILLSLSGVSASSGETITFRLYGFDASAVGGILNVASNNVPALGLQNPGIRIRGTVSNSDLYFDDGTWTPFAPDNSTFDNDAYIEDGTYTLPSDISLKSLTIRSIGNVIVPANIFLIVNNTFLESTSINYPSLIVDESSFITGIVQYDRHVNINNPGTGSTTGNNDLIAAPLSGQTFGEFATANANIVSDPNNASRKLFGPFDKTSGTYQIYNTSTDGGVTLDAGIGYRAASSNNGGFIFEGAVNTGTVTRAIENSGPQFQRWNLIGNPYPSYILLDEFLAINNSEFDVVSSGVYGYDGQASDGYSIWNQAYSDANPGAVITPGQGFLVASKDGGGTITYNPNMRTTSDADDFIAGRSSTTISHLKLNATNGVLNSSVDFYLTDNASLGLDPGYDAAVYNYNASTFAIYSHLVQQNTGIDMAIQSIGNSNLVNEVIIPLGINVAQGQQVTVSLANTTFDPSIQIYLEDNVTGTFTLLNTSDYTFTANTSLTDTGRFFLRFSNNTLSTSTETLNGIQIYTSQSPKAVFVKGLLTSKTEVNLYDIQGRLVSSSSLKSSSNSNLIDVSQLKTGVYLVKLSNTSQQKTQKIIIR